MFSSLKNYHNAIHQSERFYYANYEYYNDYQNIHKQYHEDLSKVCFHTNRKSTSTIITYDTRSTHYPKTNERLIQPVDSILNHLNQSTPKSSSQNSTIQDLIDRLVTAYHEHNYSDNSNMQPAQKENLSILILKFIWSEICCLYGDKEHQELGKLNQLLKIQQQKSQEALQIIETLYEQGNQVEGFLERWYAFQHHFQYSLETKVITDHKETKRDSYYLFQFCSYFRYILENIFEAKMYSILLMAQPYTLTLNKLLHPLTIPLQFYLQYHGQKYPKSKSPHIVILNLDGKESYHNVRAIKSLGKNVLYISIYKEPNSYDLQQTSLLKDSDEFQVSSNFTNINEVYSRLLVQEMTNPYLHFHVKPQTETPLLDSTNQAKVLLFPMNSTYAKKEYQTSFSLHNSKKKTFASSFQKIQFGNLETSEEIHFLFQCFILEQIRKFKPEMILLSYNGSIQLKNDLFREIMKSLTIFADHKVILFTNMTGLFKQSESVNHEMKDENGLEEETPWNLSKINLIEEFHSKYMPYHYPVIAEEEIFLDNIFSFIKISSGIHSLTPAKVFSPLEKYWMGKMYNYLQKLFCLSEFEHLKGYLPSLGSQQLMSLFENYMKREIKENRKENEFYERKIDEVISELMNEDIQNQLENHLQYRLKSILAQEHRELEDIKQILGEDSEQNSNTEHKNLLIEDYFKDSKSKLLLENLQSYRTNKVYYYDEEENSQNKVKCRKFCLSSQENEEISFEKYSQVILGWRKNKIFVINYKMNEERHAILYGDISYDNTICKLTEVKENPSIEALQEGMNKLNLLEKDSILVNYSHCLLKDKLYLFWPQAWNLKDQIRHKLLGLHYSPPSKQYMIQIFYDHSEHLYMYQEIHLHPNYNLTIPRLACSCWEAGENMFYAFGGIYDSNLDFYDIGSGISIFEINQKEKHFSVNNLPKKKEKAYKNNQIPADDEKFAYETILKPKMHYRIETNSNNEQNSIIISGGYGRQHTNYYSLFSSESYVFDLQFRKLYKNPKDSKRRLIKLEFPIQTNAIGKYFIVANHQNVNDVQEKFSDAPKDWFIFEGKFNTETKATEHQKSLASEIISFVDEDHRMCDFKSGHKKMYLFGFDRTIRQKIYSKIWSPELLIVEENKMKIIYIMLKTEKNAQYMTSNFLMPKEDDLTSICLDEDRLLILSNSSVILNIEGQSGKFVLYEGNFSNMPDILYKKELQMHQIYDFKSHPITKIHSKTIFTIDDKIVLIGGASQRKAIGNQIIFSREDFILERQKQKYKLKTKKIESTQDNLDLISPVVIRQNDLYLLYSIVKEEEVVINQNNYQEIIETWKIKIQTFSPNQTINEEIAIKEDINISTYDLNKSILQKRKPSFEAPKFVKIIPYQRFSVIRFKEILQKIFVKLSKISQKQNDIKMMEIVKELMKEQNEEVFLSNVRNSERFFKSYLQSLNVLESEGEQENSIEKEEVIRNLKICYSLINKLIIQSILCPKEKGENQEFRFIVEDRSSKKVKYFAIAPLNTTHLNFIRVRFRNQFSMCLNQDQDEEFYYHPNIFSCEEMDLAEKIKWAIIDEGMNEQKVETQRIQVSSYKV